MKQVLPWNLLTIMPYRDVIRYDLVLFGPGEDGTKDVLNFIHEKLNWAIQARTLRVALSPMKYWSAPERGQHAATRKLAFHYLAALMPYRDVVRYDLVLFGQMRRTPRTC